MTRTFDAPSVHAPTPPLPSNLLGPVQPDQITRLLADIAREGRLRGITDGAFPVRVFEQVRACTQSEPRALNLNDFCALCLAVASQGDLAQVAPEDVFALWKELTEVGARRAILDPMFPGHVIGEAWRSVAKKQLTPSLQEFRDICLSIANNRKIHPRWRNGWGGKKPSDYRPLPLGWEQVSANDEGRVGIDPAANVSTDPSRQMASSEYRSKLRKMVLAIRPQLTEPEYAVALEFVARVEAGGDPDDREGNISLSGDDIWRALQVAGWKLTRTNVHNILARVRKLLRDRMIGAARIDAAAERVRASLSEDLPPPTHNAQDWRKTITAVFDDYLERNKHGRSLECAQIARTLHQKGFVFSIDDVRRALARITIRMMGCLGEDLQ